MAGPLVLGNLSPGQQASSKTSLQEHGGRLGELQRRDRHMGGKAAAPVSGRLTWRLSDEVGLPPMEPGVATATADAPLPQILRAREPFNPRIKSAASQ
jgi:hypothetical protein